MATDKEDLWDEMHELAKETELSAEEFRMGIGQTHASELTVHDLRRMIGRLKTICKSFEELNRIGYHAKGY